MNSQLTDAEERRLSQELRHLGERTHEFADDLRAAGFSAFVPYQQFIESFAAEPADLRIHYEFTKETAIAERISPSYLSPGSLLMQELKEAAERSYLRSDPATEWIPRLHFDPCVQASFVLQVRNPHEYNRRWDSMLDARASCLRAEKAIHSTGVSQGYPLGMTVKPVRFKYAAHIIERELAPLGFQRTRLKASRGAVVVQKSVSERFALGWSIDDPPLFYLSPSQGSCVLRLDLQTAAVKQIGPNHQPAVEPLPILFQALVDGFSTAYSSFEDLDMLETNIRAHVQLYRIVGPSIERVVAEFL